MYDRVYIIGSSQLYPESLQPSHHSMDEVHITSYIDLISAFGGLLYYAEIH